MNIYVSILVSHAKMMIMLTAEAEVRGHVEGRGGGGGGEGGGGSKDIRQKKGKKWSLKNGHDNGQVSLSSCLGLKKEWSCKCGKERRGKERKGRTCNLHLVANGILMVLLDPPL